MKIFRLRICSFFIKYRFLFCFSLFFLAFASTPVYSLHASAQSGFTGSVKFHLTAGLARPTVSELNRLALEEFQRGNIEKALGAIERALDMEPTNPATHFNKALIFFKTTRYNQAIQECDEALSYSPNMTKAIELKRKAAFKLGKGGFDPADPRAVAGLFLEALHVNKNPDEAYKFFSTDSKMHLSLEDWKEYLKTNEEYIYPGTCTRIETYDVKEQDGLALVSYYRYIKVPMLPAMAPAFPGISALEERHSGTLDMVNENGEWKVAVYIAGHANPEMVRKIKDNFESLKKPVPSMVRDNDGWIDRDIYILDRLIKHARIFRPQRADELSAEKAVMTYYKKIMRGEYNEVYSLLSDLMKQKTSPDTFSGELNSREARRVLKRVKILKTTIKGDLCAVVVELYMDVWEDPRWEPSRLTTLVPLVREAGEWKIIEDPRSPWFKEKFPDFSKDFSVGEERFEVRTGTGWVDRSESYRRMRDRGERY